MASLKPLEELALLVRGYYPEATPEEIAEITLEIVSKEILPDVMKNIKLPDFPSYRLIAMDKTAKAKETTTIEKSVDLSSRRRIIQQIEGVRYKMGWDGIDDLTPKNFNSSNSSNALYFSEKISAKDQNQKPKKDILLDKAENRRIEGTSIKMEEVSNDYISFTDSIQKKIVSESILEKLLSQIEIELRKAILSQNIKAEIELTYKTDFEVASWNKYVLKIHPITNLKFDERMNISTRIDLLVRKTINNMKSNSEPQTTEYLRDISRNFFVHIDV
ncbi:MAG: hypothetical protein ABSA75_09285 [Candidatus Bathyarchaeia archaeon]|jgi:hypothetical protein